MEESPLFHHNECSLRSVAQLRLRSALIEGPLAKCTKEGAIVAVYGGGVLSICSWKLISMLAVPFSSLWLWQVLVSTTHGITGGFVTQRHGRFSYCLGLVVLTYDVDPCSYVLSVIPAPYVVFACVGFGRGFILMFVSSLHGVRGLLVLSFDTLHGDPALTAKGLCRDLRSSSSASTCLLIVVHIMGGDPVVTEPDVKELLDKAGLLDFFQKFSGFSESISMWIAESWDEGRVKVDSVAFTISKQLIAEASGLPADGEVICHEKTNQSVVQVMKYLTLEGKGKLPLHQGLLKMLVNHEKARIASTPLILKGNLIRTSGTPVTKAQLLLGPASSVPRTSANSDSERVEDSSNEDVGVAVRKKGDSRKQKVATQVLVASLAKCSKHSTKLQKKSVNKVKIIDYVDSSEDEKLENHVDKPVDSERVGKDSDPLEEIKDSAKIPPDNHNVLKELKSHLKVLNSLGGSLTGTYACINLLTLEIANYLKEVVSRLKELNSGRS
eukprot:Gb_28838 [translate_table: standard]